MNKLLRYWNQNKQKILITLAVIAFAIIFIKITNAIVKKQNLNENNNKTNTSKIQDVKKPNQSTITGQEVPEQTTEQNTNIIKKFVDYCNNNQIQEAYELLSDEEKKEFANNVNLFANNYCSKIFKIKKTYNLELIAREANVYIYKITYYEDNLLSTGGQTTTNNTEDYITIINQNGENKLNINGFIKSSNINKSQNTSNIQIIVNSKKTYRSYEIYNITIKNNTQNTIKISEGIESKDICLIDQNNTQYPSMINEIPIHLLSLKIGQQTTLDIRFNKMYDIYRTIQKIQFSNIKLNEQNSTKILINI